MRNATPRHSSALIQLHAPASVLSAGEHCRLDLGSLCYLLACARGPLEESKNLQANYKYAECNSNGVTSAETRTAWNSEPHNWKTFKKNQK